MLDNAMKELKELGVEIITDQEVEGKFGFGVEFDLFTEVDYTDFCAKDCLLKKLTGRKDFLYVKFTKYNKETKILTVTVAQPCPDYAFLNFTEESLMIGTTFPDFCWYYAEGSTPDSQIEVDTPFREGVEMGDLSWITPARFADNFIEIMHTLNQSILLGLMQHTVCYGPIAFSE